MGGSIILLIIGVPLVLLGIAIYCGVTALIHEYHRRNVTDHRGYGRAMGVAVLIIGMALCIAAVIPMFVDNLQWLANSLFFASMVVAIVRICFIQWKYNGGVFG